VKSGDNNWSKGEKRVGGGRTQPRLNFMEEPNKNKGVKRKYKLSVTIEGKENEGERRGWEGS